MSTNQLARKKISKVTPEQIQRIISLIESGSSERAACKMVGVNRPTFRNAALRHEADSQYAHALEALAADQIEKMEQTIEDMRAGVVDSSMARVELDARKWFASKLLPKKYGDKLDVTSGGQALPTPILGVMPAPDTTRDVIEGEIVELDETPKELPSAEYDEPAPTTPEVSNKKPKNIMGDINVVD